MRGNLVRLFDGEKLPQSQNWPNTQTQAIMSNASTTKPPNESSLSLWFFACLLYVNYRVVFTWRERGAQRACQAILFETERNLQSSRRSQVDMLPCFYRSSAYVHITVVFDGTLQEMRNTWSKRLKADLNRSSLDWQSRGYSPSISSKANTVIGRLVTGPWYRAEQVIRSSCDRQSYTAASMNRPTIDSWRVLTLLLFSVTARLWRLGIAIATRPSKGNVSCGLTYLLRSFEV